MKPRSVTFVCVSPGRKGPSRTLLSFVRYMCQTYEVSLAIPDGFVSRNLTSASEPVTILQLPDTYGRSKRGSRLRAAVRMAVHSAKPPDVIHANGLSALNVAAPLGLRHSLPVLVHVHAPEFSSRTVAAIRIWRRAGLRVKLHPVSRFTEDALRDAGLFRILGGVLPNPIDSVEFAPTVSTYPSEGDARFHVAWVGGGEYVKGIDILVEIASRLHHSGIRWHIYGTGAKSGRPLVDRCRAAIAERGLQDSFVWEGEGELDDVSRAYTTNDALLVTSRLESFSRVVAEGLAAGLPVVATETGGIPELIESGTNGLLYRPDDPDQAANHLRLLMRDPRARKEFSLRGRTSALNLRTEVVGPLLEHYYSMLLEEEERT